jgi:hypothetical protein
MASRNAQTWSKRAREQAVKERRDLKREKKAQAAADRAAGIEAPSADVALHEDVALGEEDVPPVAADPTPPQEA